MKLYTITSLNFIHLGLLFKLVRLPLLTIARIVNELESNSKFLDKDNFKIRMPFRIYSRFIVKHVDDGFGCVRDEVPHNVLVTKLGAVMQGSLSRRVNRQ